jgi:transcriptional regulator with XRE-family HTH domain
MAKKKVNHRQALGAVLRARRVDAGMTMQDFAAKCGLSQAQISRIETGHQGFRLETLMQICRVLGMNVSVALLEAGL